jgi:hypothetical protein
MTAPPTPPPLFSFSTHEALRILFAHCERTGVAMPDELRIAIAHALKFRGVICPTCGKGCRNMQGLRDHQQAKHAEAA